MEASPFCIMTRSIFCTLREKNLAKRIYKMYNSTLVKQNYPEILSFVMLNFTQIFFLKMTVFAKEQSFA